MRAIVIEVKQLRKRFAGRSVVDDVSFHVQQGHNLVLLGGSGSGKTTTLKMINRLLEPDGGEVLISGESTKGLAPHVLCRRIGYVSQGVGLFPNMTVAQNIGITPALLGWSRENMDARTRKLLEMVELPFDTIAQRFPDELSGGQAQRVGVARALAAQPSVMLLDEPFGALDPLTRDSLQRFFLKLQRTMRLTAVFVTHDMFEALLLGDWIVVMHEGKIVQQGTPQALLTEPANPYVAELMSTPARQAEYVDGLLAKSSPGFHGG